MGDTWTNRAISYIRFSSPKQTHGDSLRRQTQTTAEFCQRHSLILDESYTFRDLAVSGYLGKNASKGDLKLFLDMVKEGRVPRGYTLILEKLDRLSRDQPMRQMRLIADILESGIRVATTNPDRFYTESDINENPYIAYEILSHAMSGYSESKKKSERCGAAWAQKREAARKGIPQTKTCAGWLRLKRDRSGYEEIPDQADIVRRIFRLAADGQGSPIITRTLNAEGIPAFKGGVWRFQLITRMLKDRRVLGELQPKRETDEGDKPIGEPIKGYYPPVVDEDTFALVQTGLRTRHPNPKRGRPEKWSVNIFRGLLFDARSGSPYGLNSHECSNRIYATRKRVRLVVREQLDSGKGVKNSFIYDKLESAFFRFVIDLRAADFAGRSGDDAERLASLSSRLTLVGEKIDEIKARYKAAGNAKKAAPLMDMLMELEEEKQEIKADYDALKMRTASPAVECVSDAQTLIGLIDQTQDKDALRLKIRARIRQLIDSIWMIVFDLGGCRHAVTQVVFPDNTYRMFICGYSLTPKPYREPEFGTDRKPLSEIVADLRNYRERHGDALSPVFLAELAEANDLQVRKIEVTRN